MELPKIYIYVVGYFKAAAGQVLGSSCLVDIWTSPCCSTARGRQEYFHFIYHMIMGEFRVLVVSLI
jgi:hypothetical protein